MSALTEYFFAPVRDPESRWTVVRWWESRRLAYNVAVGSAGFFSLAVIWFFSALPPVALHGGGPPWQFPIVYGIIANIFYSFGAVADLAARRLGGRDFAPVGPTIFRNGFVFSIGLTLLPVPMAAFSYVMRLVQWLF